VKTSTHLGDAAAASPALQNAGNGRDLQQEYVERTLGFIYRLWGHAVVLETLANGQKTLLAYGETGFLSKPLK
jgi:spore cortex formation protein SpoVR/YcgB (stage V sporulation)